TNEVYESVVKRVGNSVEPRILSDLACYTFEKKVNEVTDSDIMTANLKMNLRELDIENRVMVYFVDFDRLVEKHGLTGILGPEKLDNAEDIKHRCKDRCKTLIDNLVPAVLKTDIKRLVSIQHRQANTNDVQLRSQIVERAKEQQHFHQLSSKKGDNTKKQETKKSDSGKEAATTVPKDSKEVSKPKQASDAEPMKVTCSICKGPHRMNDCPIATPELRAAALERVRSSGSKEPTQAKKVREEGRLVDSLLRLNGKIEVDLCPDSGAERNIISQRVMTRLLDADDSVKVHALGPPLALTLADEDFLLGNITLRLLGIDIDFMLEQLAGTSNDGDAGDNTAEELSVETDIDEELHGWFERMLRDAEANGFTTRLIPKLAVQSDSGDGYTAISL
ncbi:hypothetical protein PHMEG_00034990, partial [Phytophthora megakarya]